MREETEINNKSPGVEVCYRLFIIMLAVGYIAFIPACFIVSNTAVGSEQTAKRAAVILPSIFYALVLMTFATLIICWFAMKKTGRANLMLTTPFLAVICIFLALNIRWVYVVYAYGSDNEDFVEASVGTTVESYYDFLSSIRVRQLLLGFAVAGIIILGAISFFHMRRERKYGAA